MPVPPYSWKQGDFVTSSRLMQELRNFMGVGPLAPNGVAWHMKRPVYKTRFLTPAAASTGAVNTIASASSGTASPIASGMGFFGGDLATAMMGAWCDLGDYTNGGGSLTGGQGGGLVFGAGTIEMGGTAATTSGDAYFQTGFYVGTGEPLIEPIYGTMIDGGSNSHTQNVWGAAILDSYSGLSSAFRGAQTLGTVASGSSASDGSGQGTFLEGFWVCVAPGFGQVYSGSSLPVVSSWSGGVTSTDLNASVYDVMTILNNPPVMQSQSSSNIVYTANAQVALTQPSSPNYDTYSALSTSGIYTCPLDGLYLVCGFAGTSVTTEGSQSYVATGFRINGGTGASDYMGPLVGCYNPDTRIRGGAIRIFSLKAGDTIQQVARANFASTSTIGGNFTVVWLGYNTVASPLPTLPDPTTQYTAGMSPADTQAAFAQLTNDLTFLTQRPYGMCWDSVNTAALTSGGAIPGLTNYTCPVHGDSANGWGGMNSGVFTAPRDGWYVLVGEHSISATTQSAGGAYSFCGFAINPHGSNTLDYWEGRRGYGHTSGLTAGSSAFGVYYLRQGDTATLVGGYLNTSAASIAGATSPVWQSHFEAVWLSN